MYNKTKTTLKKETLQSSRLKCLIHVFNFKTYGLVPEAEIESALSNENSILSAACLPVSPFGQLKKEHTLLHSKVCSAVNIIYYTKQSGTYRRVQSPIGKLQQSYFTRAFS